MASLLSSVIGLASKRCQEEQDLPVRGLIAVVVQEVDGFTPCKDVCQAYHGQQNAAPNQSHLQGIQAKSAAIALVKERQGTSLSRQATCHTRR